MKNSNLLLKYTDEELYAELKRRRVDKEMLEVKQLNINEITVKDFIVEYADWYVGPKEPDFNPKFSFYIKKGKKKYCIYYDFKE